MNRKLRPAFTLVELLVVITIIGMLIALLLPAVNSARESGRQTTCMNNQRNYGTALQEYVTAKDYYPAYRSFMSPSLTAPGTFPVSWQVNLLPNMGKQDVYQAMQNSPDSFSQLPYIELSVCPSDNSIVGRSSPWTSYVANTGRLDLADGSGNPLPDRSSNSGPVNGVFTDGCFYPANSQRRLKVSLTDVVDGHANTLMLSENVDAHYYTHFPFEKVTVNLPNPPSQNQIDKSVNCSERGTGFVMWWDTAPSTGPVLPPLKAPPTAGIWAAINKQRGDHPDLATGGVWSLYRAGNGVGTTALQNYAARPSSNHPGGVVAVFVAGNTKFLSEDMEYDIYCLLMSPAGSKFKNAEPVLTDGAY